MRRSAYGIAALLFLLLCGCSHVTDYIAIAKKNSGTSEIYLRALESWTRSATIYSEFETKVKITATWKSPAFNKAYLEEYARIKSLREGEKKVKEGVQAELAEDFTEFFFYAATPEKAENDFNRRNSLWSIFLLDRKGNRIDPTEIRRIEKITPHIVGFYPYVNQYYGNCYSLKFPPLQGEDAGARRGEGNLFPLKLIFASVLGTVELKWED